MMSDLSKTRDADLAEKALDYTVAREGFAGHLDAHFNLIGRGPSPAFESAVLLADAALSMEFTAYELGKAQGAANGGQEWLARSPRARWIGTSNRDLLGPLLILALEECERQGEEILMRLLQTALHIHALDLAMPHQSATSGQVREN